MKSNNGGPRRRSLLVALAVVLWLAQECSTWAEVVIFDGKPKKVVHFHQNSWKLGVKSADVAALGLGYLQFVGSGFDFPIGDDLQPKKGTFLTDGKGYLGPCTLSTEKLPVILILPIPSTSGTDNASVDKAVARMLKCTDLCIQLGADLVLYSNKHYRWARYRDRTSPQPDGDPLVVDAYNNALGKRAAADVRSRSIVDYPYTVVSDLEHPTGYCQRLYSAQWLQMLYLHEGKSPPTSLETDLASALATAKAKHGYATASMKSPVSPLALRVGNNVSIEIRVNEARIAGGLGYVRALGYRSGSVGLFKIKDSLALAKSVGASTIFSFAMPESASVSHYSPAGKPNWHLVEGDSLQIQVLVNPASWNGTSNTFDLTKSFRYLNRNGEPAASTADVKKNAHAAPPELLEGGRAFTVSPLGRLISGTHAALAVYGVRHVGAHGPASHRMYIAGRWSRSPR